MSLSLGLTDHLLTYLFTVFNRNLIFNQRKELFFLIFAALSPPPPKKNIPYCDRPLTLTVYDLHLVI